MKSDLITICVPTHRRPSLLLHTLHSCLAQDYRPLQIDVSDDSPGDESHEVVASLVPPEGVTIRYWRNRPALGQAGNVNLLFAKAQGRRLVLIHDDDLLLPGSISAMAEAWDAVPDVVAVFGKVQIMRNSGEIDDAETEAKALYFKRDLAHAGIQRELLVSAFWRQFPSNGYLIDTLSARAAGYRSFEEVGHACDTDFAIRLGLQARGKCYVILERMTSRYRYNLASLSRTNDVMWKFYEYLLSLDALTPAETEARDALLRDTAAQATKENALRGRRGTALKIFFSQHYPMDHSIFKSIYHLLLIVTPRARGLRRLPKHANGLFSTPEDVSDRIVLKSGASAGGAVKNLR